MKRIIQTGLPAAVVILLAFAAPAVYAASNPTPAVPVQLPPDTFGNESAEPGGGANGFPETDSVHVVCVDIDYGGNSSCPTNYTTQRHVAFAENSYYVAWEWGESRDNHVTESHWESFGPIGYWTYPATIDTSDTGIDSGRISLLGRNDGSLCAVWHQLFGGEYDIWFGYPTGSGWFSTPVTPVGDGIECTFPNITETAEGDLWVGYEHETLNTFFLSKSTDGGTTWGDMQQLLEYPVVDAWNYICLGSDPLNGDFWVSYVDTATVGDMFTDLITHRYDSATETFGPRIIIEEGYFGANPFFPSICINSDHLAHIIFQSNIADFGSEGVLGYNYIGGAGPIKYVYGDEGGWSTPELVTGDSPTDTTTGPPQLGMDDYGNLAVTFSQIDSTDGAYFFNTFDTYACVRQASFGVWEERINVSNLGAISPSDSFHTMYPHITEHIPASGPGIFWSELINASPPARVCFARLPWADVESETPPQSVRTAAPTAAPNPFNPVTTISFNLAERGDVRLSIYDATGRLVKRLADESMEAGSHAAVWNGASGSGGTAASGVYFCRLEVGNASSTSRLVMVK